MQLANTFILLFHLKMAIKCHDGFDIFFKDLKGTINFIHYNEVMK